MNSFIVRLANLNLILVICGYQFVTSLFSGLLTDNTQLITVPFRAFTLLIALLTITLTIGKKQLTLTAIIYLLFFYWILLFMRFGEDMLITRGFSLTSPKIFQTFLYMLFLTVIPMIAVIKSFQYIDFERTLYFCFILLSISVILTLITNQNFQEATNERIDANAALNTITTGHMGLKTLILGIIIYNHKRIKLSFKYFIIIVCLISFFIFLRAGSRGPILSATFIILFFIFSKIKSHSKAFFICLGLFLIIYIFQSLLIDVLDQISPILKERLIDRDDATDDRDPLFLSAIFSFLENPLFGNNFAIVTDEEDWIYPHNIFLESLMQLGIVGLTIILYIICIIFKRCYKLIHENSKILWIVLIFLQCFSGLLVSGSITTNPEFSILIIIISLYYKHKLSKRNKYHHSIQVAQ